MSQGKVSVEVVLISKTPTALLVSLVGGDKQVWLPLSQIDACDEIGGVTSGSDLIVEITIPEWLAKDRGLV